MRPARRFRRRAAAALLGTALLAGCAVNPVTGETQLSLVSESQEIEIGRQGAAQAAQQIGLVDDEALQQYVQGIGERLARDSERPGLPWTFRVLDDPTPNAFAFPGGYVFVTRGMLALMDNEAELATVIGHEIGHVTAKHSVTQISRAQLAQVGLGLGSILVPELQQYGELAGAGLQLLFLKYGRDAERQADDLGFRYARTHAYDVRQMPDVFASLARISEAEGASRLPAWASTHPAPEERIERIRAELAGLPPDSLGGSLRRAAYMQRIDGLVYGENPRAGYFQGGLFLHPDLRFQLRFPEGWQTQNMAQAVAAGSPRQDALIQLTLAEGGDAQNAARAFLSQQGVAPGRTFRDAVNGLPAVGSTFQAQTQQGVVQGLAAWVEYGGRTYQIVSFTPASRFGSYERLFSQVVGSFAPLTDPQALAVQPDRIDVVEVDRRMTLAEFASRYPSAVPAEELAILNQVEGPNAVIEPGARVKRIVSGGS